MKGCLRFVGYGLAAIAVLFVLAIIGVMLTGGGDDRPATTSRSVPTFTSTPGGASVQAAVAQEPTATSAPSVIFTAENWAVLHSDPDAHKGAGVDVVGKVFQAPQRTSEYVGIQMWALPGESEGNTLVRYDDPNFQIKDGDFVHVRGQVRGSYEGRNLMGGAVRATLIIADSMEVVDALAAAPLALRTVELNQEIVQHELSVTLGRVEYAASETRVHVVVRNASKKEASFYRHSARAVQGSTQFDSEYSSHYPEVHSSLLPGVESAGVLVFPAMDPNLATTFYLDGRTDDYTLDFENYIFQVPGP